VSVTDTSSSPHVKLRGVALRDVRWTGGLMGSRHQVCRDSMVPAMGRLMRETERHKFVGNFEVAAGVIEGRHRGPRWDDGDFYKWLEGATTVAGLGGDKDVIADVESLAQIVARAQRPDGYIHTDIQIRQRNGESVAEFDNPMDFEMYNMGHLMTLAVIHRRATGSDALLKMALKAAEFLDRVFANPQPRQARHGICPSHLMGLVELYRETRDRKHLDLARRLLEMRNLVAQEKKGDDDNQDRVPFRDHKTAHGHAVRATYLYAGMADLYAETGDETLLPPLHRVWDDLVSRKLYLTGGCGALFDGASPDGSADQLNITRVHQAFGRDWQLPQSTAHNETCAAIGNLLWNWRMLLITGDAKFADVIELTLYNSVLAGVSLDGTKYTYTNTLRKLDPMPVPLRFPADRAASLSCYCCPPNVVRTVAESANYAYLRSAEGVHVVLYGASTAKVGLPNGGSVTLEQTTEYPWDGRVRIAVTLDGPASFTLSLRVPGWAENATVRVNGSAADVAAAPGAFAAVSREWKNGDVVELDLQMPAHFVEANPYVEEARGQAAVRRGPIVYCLESCDLPAGVKLVDVAVKATSPLRVGNAMAELAGAVAIEADGAARPVPPAQGLYRPLAAGPWRPIPLRFVPYFAWGNRTLGEMSVFVPVLF
jgi:DUF1680 family protein